MQRPSIPSRSCLLVVGLTFIGLVGCPSSGSNQAVRLDGGGATFPAPLILKWKDVYKAEKNVEIDYVAEGSGVGIKGVTSGKFVFGCSDAAMNGKEKKEAEAAGGEIINVPITMGAVAIVYNLPGLTKPLVLDGKVLAMIFLGDEADGKADLESRKALKWNDKRIQELNPGVALPDSPINPVGRADSSGTSNIFTEYLSKMSPEFAKLIGTTKSLKCPKFCSLEKGSDKIAGRVKDSPFTIGYVELSYAKKSDIPTVMMKNHKGTPVMPEAKAVTAAASAALKAPKPNAEPYNLHELAYSLTDVDDEQAYPICGISYAMLFKKQKPALGKPLVGFLKWATLEGQKYAEAEYYAPLPEELTKKVHAILDTVVFE